MDRVLVMPPLPDIDYLHLIACADVILDPLHYGGVATMYDAFSLGKPVVTLPTPYQRGRNAAAMYRRMGLDFGIAENEADYVRRAVTIANDDADFRQSLHYKLLAEAETLLHDETVIDAYADVFRRLVKTARERCGKNLAS
jgi:predicted O-linked N-acetylglucosamine transferase (SPINDLY family)